jgi:Fe-S-cluster containining protein
VTERCDNAVLPAVPFFSWLTSVQAALAEEQPADVPCGECNACCRTSHFIHVRPEERRALARIPRQLLFPAPDLPPGNLVLGYDEKGCCPMLIHGRCTIYEDRPLACRTYDCRIYLAAGVVADRAAIAEQVRRWEFSHPSQDDRDRHSAVRAAARFIREHPESLPSEAARREPVRVAVLAIAVHEAFLRGATDAAGAGGSDRDRARAVVAANEKLFGDG